MTAREVHEYILRTACELGDRDPRLPLHVKGSAVFQVPFDTSKLGLRYDPAWLESFTDENKRQEFIKVMRAIAIDAVTRAVAENGDLFVGLLVGEAREGENYFDRYKESGSDFEQLGFDL